tara:strand:- start:28 stop:588 length:561 start_codon:yes stop_codon:yes gene_type:complete
MANNLETHIHIKNGDTKIIEKLKEIFTPDEGKHSIDSSDLLERLNNKPPAGFDRSWMVDEVGSKWMYSEFHLDDDLDSMELRLTSAWSVPQPFLKRLAEVLGSITEGCYIIGTYEDEGFEPIGAFVYGKDYQDIEDWDGEIDFDTIWDDDEARDKMWDDLNTLKEDLDAQYHEHLEDRRKYPEDYI